MKRVSSDQARQFVHALELPVLPMESLAAAEPAKFDFSTVKNQAMVVGSDIVSFVKGVTPEQREDIVNSSLLAQLAAKKQIGDLTKIYDWYNAYFDVLMNIGWVVQDRGFSEYTEAGDNFEAHEAIIQVATTLLGPATTALAVVQTTLKALKSMSEDNPWITLFNRESQSANTARFQVTLVEQGDKDQFLVSLMAFGLEAKSKLTQVLFFKFQSSKATLKHYSGKVTIDSDVLSSVRDLIKNKISNFSRDYVNALPDLS